MGAIEQGVFQEGNGLTSDIEAFDGSGIYNHKFERAKQDHKMLYNRLWRFESCNPERINSPVRFRDNFFLTSISVLSDFDFFILKRVKNGPLSRKLKTIKKLLKTNPWLLDPSNP